MESIWSAGFWKAAAERAVRAGAFAATGVLASTGAGLIETDWVGVASVAGGAAVLSLLTSIGVNGTRGDGPAITPAEKVVQ